MTTAIVAAVTAGIIDIGKMAFSIYDDPVVVPAISMNGVIFVPFVMVVFAIAGVYSNFGH
jgi:hypothetical protein